MSALSKPIVVLIHGMWSTPDIMSEMANAFQNEGFEVYAPRLPLHYRERELTQRQQHELSTLGLNDYVDALCTDITRHLSDRPSKRFILVGHSMGGLLAQLVASRLPCEQLIILSSAAPAGINAWALSVIKTFGHNLLLFPIWRKLTHLRLKNIQYGIANCQDSSVHQSLIRNSTYESGRATFEISCWFLFSKPPSRVDFNEIACPVLIIGGTEDRITPLPIQKSIAKRYANATFKPIAGACHFTIGGRFLDHVMKEILVWHTSA